MKCLFELKDIKEKNFKIDKTNFYHPAGSSLSCMKMVN